MFTNNRWGLDGEVSLIQQKINPKRRSLRLWEEKILINSISINHPIQSISPYISLLHI